MIRFNFLFPGTTLIILALLAVIYIVTGIPGITIFAIGGVLAILTNR
jgi:hypothetical protein